MKILEIYDQTRREIFHKFIDPVSSANLERIWIDGSTALEKDPALQFMHAASQDPAKLAHLIRVSSRLIRSGDGLRSNQKSQAQDVLTADLTKHYDLINGVSASAGTKG